MTRIIFIAFIFTLPWACTKQAGPSPQQELVALVNGEAITTEEVKIKLRLEMSKFSKEDSLPSGTMKEIRQNVFDQILQNKLILQWGQKNNVDASEQELATDIEDLKKAYSPKGFNLMLEERKIPYALWINMAKESLRAKKITESALLPQIQVTEKDVHDYYRENQDLFRVEDRVHVRQIVTDTYEKAEEMRKRLLKGENFAKLALMHSLSPDRSQGGDLGFFERGTYPEEFDRACFSLNPGELSPIVKSPYGYHIFKLIEKRPKEVLPIEEVVDKIIQQIAVNRLKKAFVPWYEGIKKESQIQIMKDVLERIEI